MESDSGDAWSAFSNMQKPVAELQEIVASPREEPRTGILLNRFELLLSTLEKILCELQNSPNQICEELTDLKCQLERTIGLVQDAERDLHHISVRLWLADMMEVLNNTEDILDEIMDANKSRLTAEVESSSKKPGKLILNLFKVSRFMHSYREKEMASKVAAITFRLFDICRVAGLFGLQPRLSTGDKLDPENLGRKQFAISMLNAIYKGKFWKVRDLFESNPAGAISTTFENGQTAIHVAITAGQLRIAKELITRTSMENSHHLRIQDKSGNTALSSAARSGMMEIAKCLIQKNKDLLTIPDADDKLPVQLACSAGHEDMTRFLYNKTQKDILAGDYGFYLLEECITKKMFHIAVHLLYRFPKFAIYGFSRDGSTPVILTPVILTLAKTPPFFRGNQLAFWRRWIYNRIRVKVDGRSFIYNDVEIVPAQQGAKNIYDLKLMDAIAHEIIRFICRQLSALDENQFLLSGAVEATFQAIKNGIPEIVIEIAKVNTNIFWNRTDPKDLRSMFACAIAHRQEEVAQFLYEFNARTGTNIGFTTDRDGNNLLHLAAKLAPRSHLDHISGAALQLQSELHWFKAVEGIVPQFNNYDKNEGRKTPFQVFVEEHKQLLKEAEAWLKKVAESSTVVGALIITIMFAVAFTVPGGNDQNTGFPIFLNKTTDSSMVPPPAVPFMVFVVSDAISLFAASSSVLMFLGILTSRYAYKDFLKSLPVKLIFGISSLFISIAAMMVAFCVALFIMLQGRLWIIIPVTLLAGIPVIIFVLLQFPFLVELYTLTFRPGIFERKKLST